MERGIEIAIKMKRNELSRVDIIEENLKGIDAREAAGAKAKKGGKFTAKSAQTGDKTARSHHPLAPISLNSARRSARPQPQGRSNTAQRQRARNRIKHAPGRANGKRQEKRKQNRKPSKEARYAPV